MFFVIVLAPCVRRALHAECNMLIVLHLVKQLFVLVVRFVFMRHLSGYGFIVPACICTLHANEYSAVCAFYNQDHFYHEQHKFYYNNTIQRRHR